MKSLAVKLGLLCIILDAVFWMILLANCIWSIDRAELLVFVPFYYYQPLTSWLSTVQVSFLLNISHSMLLLNVLLGVVGGLMHFLFGFLVGKLIQSIFLKGSIENKKDSIS